MVAHTWPLPECPLQHFLRPRTSGANGYAELWASPPGAKDTDGNNNATGFLLVPPGAWPDVPEAG